jgi:vancomycin permeability regulator SanA
MNFIYMKKLIILLFVFFLIHIIYISHDGLTDDNALSDVALVLGNKVNEDGTLSDRLKARCDKAIELFNEQRVKYIIVSGGVGKEGFSEGTKMHDYILKNGVPDSLILTDIKGNTTEATVKNYVALNRFRKFSSVTVVSQFYHITRTKKMLSDSGIENVYGASPNYFEWRDIYSTTREFLAFYWYCIFG